MAYETLCGGYDFSEGFHHWDAWTTTDGAWDSGKDFLTGTAHSRANVTSASGTNCGEML